VSQLAAEASTPDAKEHFQSLAQPWLFVQPPKGGSYTPTTFRNAWAYLMGSTPAGRIRAEGYTFHGLRASPFFG
jgi:hypothetical protein